MMRRWLMAFGAAFLLHATGAGGPDRGLLSRPHDFLPIQIAAARNPLFLDAPAIMEFAKDERTRKILQLILAPLEMDRPILAPPGVPEERVAALREAFHAAMNDPAFIAEAEKDHLEIREVSGRRIEEIFERCVCHAA
jgi:hypothetical protein